MAFLAGRGRRVTIAVLATLALLAAALLALVVAREAPVRTEDLTVVGVPEPGLGPVRLEARLYRTDAASDRRPAPAVLLAHGYGGTLAGLDGEARRLARAGYVVLTWTARGFGGSGGLVHLNAPQYEVADARALVDLLAGRGEVVMDGPGDPRVGVAGASYGGALALSLAGTDPRVDAVVPQITWNDLRRALFPQSLLASSGAPRTPALVPVTPGPDAGVFKKAWAAAFFGPGATLAGGEQSLTVPADAAAAGAVPNGLTGRLASEPGTCGRVAADLCTAYQQVAATGRPDAAMLDLLARSSPASVVSRITAPTLLIQGQNDSLFPLSEADATAQALAESGTEVAVVWSAGGHDGGPDERERWRELTLDWFETHLRGGPQGTGTRAAAGGDADVRFQVTVPGAAVSTQDSDPAPVIRGADEEPGVHAAQGVRLQQVTIRGGEQVIVTPAGGWPAAVTSLPGLRSGRTSLDASPGSPVMPPGQVAVFESAPLAQQLPLVGSGSVRLRVQADGGSATLFVSLQDVAGDGSAVLPSGLVSPVRLTGIPPAGTEVTVVLPAVVRDIPSGHRIRVVVAASDQAYALPVQSLRYRVALADDQAELSLPTPALTTLDAGGLGRYLPWAAGLLAAAALVIGGGVWWTRARRPASGPGISPSEPVPPLEVTGVAKVYRHGFQAVRDVSLRVEPGWVLGLLGPNGAGKTTLLRMVLGLIHPTAGRISVFGHEVYPGAPVLSRVGAFVEGPGFLPHATGWQNLQLYWAATGRPAADAHLTEALEVAGLGEDVHRTVRTYSHGMRQRLAIAQAMLGLPDLLVLDEPTNGLDPPQIREMREVLARYAATGRTVVVSSHLLSEVEQTCTHVVVMHHGEVVATGAVAELVGAATGLLVEVDDAARAAQVASGVPGARAIEIVAASANGARTGTMTLELVGTARSELVRALVGAGLAVERVTPRRGLEQAFLALVGEAETVPEAASAGGRDA